MLWPFLVLERARANERWFIGEHETFVDDMSGNLEDNWEISVWPNAYNNEYQYYTDEPGNVKIKGGKLVITPKREKYAHRDYTSGRVQSKYAFKYGRLEVVAKSPKGISLIKF